ncbi:uncharacterized protein LOC129589461 [Paramacrobiotus metropolitanus]|uniref:uncharacterized protein LOC129589461 n=1 Tax=Paramacrobiotus metropolitanus TaxID=2943436 RepID=UPI0024458001|nr:uncharacterized protein LOC129589461 [Paramacrobiotus metropolitanus]
MCGGFQRQNSVHVLGRDGRLRYGRVVALTKDGLFVDLLCPNRHREFYTFDNCFLPRLLSGDFLARLYTAPVPRIPVVVLVPETPSGPWMWVPGEMPCQQRGVRYAWCEAAVVHWPDTVTGVPCTDILPIERIRCPLLDMWRGDLPYASELERMVQEEWEKRAATPAVNYAELHVRTRSNTFYHHYTHLGREFRSLSAEHAATLIRLWNNRRPYHPWTEVCLVDLVADRVDCIYKSGIMYFSNIGSTLTVSLQRFHDEWMHAKEAVDDFSGLPTELWREVFAQSDTITQTRIRSVCVTWNMILDSPALTTSIIIRHDTHCNQHSDTPCPFLPSALLYKHLRPGVQRVYLIDREHKIRTDDLLKIPDIMYSLASQRTGLRLTTLYLVGVQLNLFITGTNNSLDNTPCVLHDTYADYRRLYVPLRGYGRLEDFIRIGRRVPGGTLRLVDCTMKWMCPLKTQHGRRRGPVVSVELPEICLPLSGDFGAALWTAVEAALPVPGDAALQELAQWRDWVLGLGDDHPEKIAGCKVLCAVQSSDPRPSSHYRGKRWCLDGLEDVQLALLSRITLCILMQLALPSGKGWISA